MQFKWKVLFLIVVLTAILIVTIPNFSDFLKRDVVKKKQLNATNGIEVTVDSTKSWLNKLRDGDIIFQTSLSSQSAAVQAATQSRWSHCGLIFNVITLHGKEWFVLEAVQPVKWTSIADWIKRGEQGKFEVKRLRDDYKLSDSLQFALRTEAEKHINKNYDVFFEWNNESMYCSELIWKSYLSATGLSIGKLQKLSDFDLSSACVQSLMNERYGPDIPQNEQVISPKAIYESELLELVIRSH